MWKMSYTFVGTGGNMKSALIKIIGIKSRANAGRDTRLIIKKLLKFLFMKFILRP